MGPLWLVTGLGFALAAVTRSYVYVSLTPGLVLLLVDVIAPAFVLSIAVAVVTVRLDALERDEGCSFLGAWSRLRSRGQIALVALIPVVVMLLATRPPTARLLVLLLFHGILGPPFVMQAAALEGHPVRGALARAKELLEGRGPRTVLYLVNVVVGTGLITLFVRGVIAYATIGSRLVALPVQALVTGLVLGYLVAFEYVLFKHLVAAQADPNPG